MGCRGSRCSLVGDCFANQMLLGRLVYPETKYGIADGKSKTWLVIPYWEPFCFWVMPLCWVVMCEASIFLWVQHYFLWVLDSTSGKSVYNIKTPKSDMKINEKNIKHKYVPLKTFLVSLWNQTGSMEVNFTIVSVSAWSGMAEMFKTISPMAFALKTPFSLLNKSHRLGAFCCSKNI